MNTMLRHVNKCCSEVANCIFDKRVNIEDIGICDCGYKTDNIFPAEDSFRSFPADGIWGNGNDTHAWFHVRVAVPQDMKNPTLELLVETERNGWDADNPQFLCYIDGKIRQGMDTNHRTVLLCDADGNVMDNYDVYLYAYTGPRVEHAKLYVALRTKHPEAEKFYYDLRTPLLALGCIPENSIEYMQMLDVMHNACLFLNLIEPRGEEFYRSVMSADRYLNDFLYKKLKPSNKEVTCIGHTHIDIAWLWTVAQTREKAQRSFATVIELMKRYPEYKFMSSQAFLYKAVKEEAPELYNEIKKMVKEGRWEVEGAMWVEADCNLTSGESLVRQIMYGKNFFRDEFGVDSHILWLPDVFGYSAALPQILKKCGVDWFVTSKISWNDENTMPYDVFEWRGLDGTGINTYFLTAQDKGHGSEYGRSTTYVADTRPSMIAGSYNRFMQKKLFGKSMVTFGFGDGGGGPTAEMIEVGKRQTTGLPGLPDVKFEFAGKMLGELAKKIKDNPELPEWQGELYLEFHRGTYTSNARNKKNNRNCEFLFLDTELLSVMDMLHGGVYPRERLRKCWETILVNQFHDIIPGSSIREVYEVCDREYAWLRDEAAQMRQNAIDTAVLGIKTDKNAVVFNPHSFIGDGIVMHGGKSIYVRDIPPKGYRAVELVPVESGITVNERRVTSKFYTCEFDKNYEICKLYDRKNSRDILRCGENGNQLRVYEDYPDQYDAWEIQDYSAYKYYAAKNVQSVETVTDGARTGIKITRLHGASTITQTVWFYDDMPRIDFETELDWHEKHQILRAAFPVDINTDHATFDVQYGTIERPTHMNTSWDRAKFETCGHKYADLSEGNYGISLLNDCKYGHDIHDGVMQLTLLKCPTYPNEVADQGEHHFTYSLLPHAGALDASDTLREAYMLNYPMYAVDAIEGTGELPEKWSLVSVDDENVVIETVKLAEYGNDIIVRMYEAKNFRMRTKVKFGFDVSAVYVGNLMENTERMAAVKNNTVTLDIKPREIITLIVKK